MKYSDGTVLFLFITMTTLFTTPVAYFFVKLVLAPFLGWSLDAFANWMNK